MGKTWNILELEEALHEKSRESLLARVNARVGDTPCTVPAGRALEVLAALGEAWLVARRRGTLEVAPLLHGEGVPLRLFDWFEHGSRSIETCRAVYTGEPPLLPDSLAALLVGVSPADSRGSARRHWELVVVDAETCLDAIEAYIAWQRLRGNLRAMLGPLALVLVCGGERWDGSAG